MSQLKKVLIIFYICFINDKKVRFFYTRRIPCLTAALTGKSSPFIVTPNASSETKVAPSFRYKKFTTHLSLGIEGLQGLQRLHTCIVVYIGEFWPNF